MGALLVASQARPFGFAPVHSSTQHLSMPGLCGWFYSCSSFVYTRVFTSGFPCLSAVLSPFGRTAPASPPTARGCVCARHSALSWCLLVLPTSLTFSWLCLAFAPPAYAFNSSFVQLLLPSLAQQRISSFAPNSHKHTLVQAGVPLTNSTRYSHRTQLLRPLVGFPTGRVKGFPQRLSAVLFELKCSSPRLGPLPEALVVVGCPRSKLLHGTRFCLKFRSRAYTCYGGAVRFSARRP